MAQNARIESDEGWVRLREPTLGIMSPAQERVIRAVARGWGYPDLRTFRAELRDWGWDYYDVLKIAYG